MISAPMNPPYFPVDYQDIQAKISYIGLCGEEVQVGSITVSSIPLSHPNQGMGYRFMEDGKSFVFLTDNEPTYPHLGGRDWCDYVEFSRGADLLMHDSEYLPEEYDRTVTWGHTSYIYALKLALESGVDTFCLFHHNQDRTDEDIDAMVEDCRRRIREIGSSMKCFAASQDMEIEL